MNNYGLTLVIKNDLDEKARKELLDSVTKNFGKVTKEDLWGSRNLAYPIQHQDKGYFAHFEFESEPNTISSLDKMVKLNEDILRYLLLRSEIKKIKASKTEKAGKKIEKKAEEETAEEK